MKANLKLMLPLLVVVLGLQFFLVRSFLGTSNESTQKIIGEFDANLPHPSSRYEAEEVVKVVLYALKLNDLPEKDSGLKTLWQFLTLRFRETLRDKALVGSFLGEDNFFALKDYEAYDIKVKKIEKEAAYFEVELRSSTWMPRKAQFSLVKVQGLWLIDHLTI